MGLLLWAETGWNTVSACEAPHIANMHQESFPGRIPGVAVQIVSAGVLPPPCWVIVNALAGGTQGLHGLLDLILEMFQVRSVLQFW